MFQRRMILVANRLQNAQLTAPKLFSSSKAATGADDDAVDNNGDAAAPVADEENVAQSSRSMIEKATTTASTAIKSSVSALKDFDTLAFQLRNKSLQTRRNCSQKLKRNAIHLSFLVYLAVGTAYYSLDRHNQGIQNTSSSHFIMGYYESMTVGFSVGLGNKDPNYIPNPWFSSVYILAGAFIIAVMLTTAGNQVEEFASMSMFQSLQRRENYEKKMSRSNPLRIRIKAFLSYNAAYLIVILLWLGWLVFVIIWALVQVPEWTFADAQYFAISMCSAAGSLSMPTTSSETAYLLAAISMMVGVPLMAMGVSAVIIMVWQGHRFKTVKEAAWADVTQDELDLLGKLGVVDIAEGEELPKGGFILLGLFRMGQDVGVIKYLADAHKAAEDRGGVIIRATKSSRHFANVSGFHDETSEGKCLRMDATDRFRDNEMDLLNDEKV